MYPDHIINIDIMIMMIMMWLIYIIIFIINNHIIDYRL